MELHVHTGESGRILEAMHKPDSAQECLNQQYYIAATINQELDVDCSNTSLSLGGTLPQSRTFCTKTRTIYNAPRTLQGKMLNPHRHATT